MSWSKGKVEQRGTHEGCNGLVMPAWAGGEGRGILLSLGHLWDVRGADREAHTKVHLRLGGPGGEEASLPSWTT